MPTQCPRNPCACENCNCGCGPTCRCGDACNCDSPKPATAAE